MIRMFTRDSRARVLTARLSSGNSLRVLHIIGTLNRGGAEIFLLNLVRSSAALPIDIHVLCYGDQRFDLEADFRAFGVTVHRIARGSSIFQQFRAIRSIRPDVVHAHTDLNAGISMTAAWFNKVSLTVTHSHNTVFGPADSPYWRKFYEGSMLAAIRWFTDLRIACGDDAGRAMFRNSDYVVQQNGVDINQFLFNPDKRRKIRSQLGPITEPENVFMLGIVARLEPVKNHAFILGVLGKLVRELPSVQLILVGRGSCEMSLRKLTAEIGISRSVRFLGVRDDIADLLNAFDAMALPSFHEGFPVSMIEAQVNGVPLVVSDRVDSSTLLNDNCVGRPIQGNHAEQAWVDAILDVAHARVGRRPPSPEVLRFDALNIGPEILSRYQLAFEKDKSFG